VINRKLEIILCLVVLVLACLATVPNDQPPVIFMAGFLGFIGKAVGGLVKGIGKVVGTGVKIAASITGISQPQPGQTVVTMGTPAAPAAAPVQAGFMPQIMAFRIAGIPVIPVVGLGLLAWFFFFKRKGR
jgi:hypothetical protein